MILSKRLVLTIIVMTSAAFTWGLAAGRYKLFPSDSAEQFVHFFRPPSALTAPAGARYEQRKLLFQMSRGHVDVVMLGDSITEIPDWRELFPGINIANRGINGDTTQGTVKRLDSVILLHPHKVFVI